MSQRKRLQRNGSQSARQHLKKASGRERRHVTHVNNVVSKEIVQEAVKRGIKLIALEDLTHIRDHIKAGKRIRSRLHRWSFRELQDDCLQSGSRWNPVCFPGSALYKPDMLTVRGTGQTP
ncbi:MAG: IS200/IS605 family accessory protein TnpB-related protein [Duodenibacillus massiliensis]